MDPEVNKKIQKFFSGYPKRSFDKGQILVHAGDDPQHIFYIVNGNVRQYDISYRGDEIVVNVFKPSAFFPMLWAVTKRPNRYFFGAETDLETRIAPSEEVVGFLKENPDVLYDLLARLYMGVDGLLGRMAHLMAGSAKSRLMYELIIEAKRFGEPKNDGSHVITVNETALAARTGLSRETISREMRKLSQDDLVSVKSKGIIIKNLVGLEQKLGTEL